MSVHEQYADDLALHALGALRGEELVVLQKHLQTCGECSRELEQLRGDTALIGVSVTGAHPPDRSRKRLLEAIAGEPRHSPVHTRRPAWGWLGWAVAAAAIVLAAIIWRQNAGLQRSLAESSHEQAREMAELQRARRVVAALTSTDAMHVTLVHANTPPQPQGRTIYSPHQGTLIFVANNMPALPAQKAYELWLIPMQGAPLPAGVFKPDTHGNVSLIAPPMPNGTQAKAFAITVEPEAGSPAPTSPVMMVGTGE